MHGNGILSFKYKNLTLWTEVVKWFYTVDKVLTAHSVSTDLQVGLNKSNSNCKCSKARLICLKLI